MHYDFLNVGIVAEISQSVSSRLFQLLAGHIAGEKHLAEEIRAERDILLIDVNAWEFSIPIGRDQFGL